MNRVAFNSTPLSLLWLMFCAMINASDPTFHLFCGFKYPPSCFCVCWKMKMQIRSMKQVNFVNSSIHYSGLKYPPSCFSVYLENKNAYLKQETSEIVVKSIHHGGLLFNCIIINLKSSENKERWRLSTVSFRDRTFGYLPSVSDPNLVVRCWAAFADPKVQSHLISPYN